MHTGTLGDIEWDKVIADGVEAVCGGAELTLIGRMDQFRSKTNISHVLVPEYDPVLCPLVRGEGEVDMVEVAEAIGSRVWGRFMDVATITVTNVRRSCHHRRWRWPGAPRADCPGADVSQSHDPIAVAHSPPPNDIGTPPP